MSFIAILMFSTLTIALAIGIWQMSKMDEILPEDRSHVSPERSLQRMDRSQNDSDIRGTKKAPVNT